MKHKKKSEIKLGRSETFTEDLYSNPEAGRCPKCGGILVTNKTDITPYDGCYLVTEYCVLPEIYDEDGEIVESGDIEEITEMKIGVEDEEWNVVKTFDNLKEADDFIHSDERELTLIY